MNWLNRFNPFSKRQQNNIKISAGAFKPGQNYSPGYGNSLSSPIARIVNLFHACTVACPIKGSNEDSLLLKLLNNRPCSTMTRSAWFQILVQNLLLYSNFFSIVRMDSNGIKSLDPYISPLSVRVYPRAMLTHNDPNTLESEGLDYADPYLLSSGRVYKDYRSRVLSEDECLHIADMRFNQHNLYEGESIFKKTFGLSTNLATQVENVLYNIALSDMKAPVLLSGLGIITGENRQMHTQQPTEVKETMNALQEFFKRDAASNPSGVIALPPGMSVSKLDWNDSPGIIQVLADQSALQLARVYNVPSELVYTSSIQTERTAKQALRYFIGVGFRSFAKLLEESFSQLTDYEEQFNFDLDALRTKLADIREEVQLAQLYTSGILSKQEVKEKIQNE